ncbi:NAD(P)/FAD-dependent oxidoreductase [Cupriavidus sp. PET2-C1]
MFARRTRDPPERNCMTAQNRVVVIGGGIIGASCAWHARTNGLKVTLVDPGDEQARASYGNAGVLATCEYLPVGTPSLIKELPRMLLAKDSPLQFRWRYLPTLTPWLLRFIRASNPAAVDRAGLALKSLLSEAVAAHHEIANAAGAGNLLRASGWIKAYESANTYRALESERRYLSRLGVNMTALSMGDLDTLLPGLRGIFTHGTLFDDCMQVTNPGAYLARITTACQEMGVEFVKGKAHCFVVEGGKVAAVQTSAGQVSGDTFVIAAGAWSASLAQEAGHNVSLDTERGYHAMLEVPCADFLHAPVFWHDRSAVLSQQDHRLRITSSVEFAGLDAPPRYDGIDRVVRSIGRAVPSLAAPVLSKWLGFRPSTPDSLPVIGRSEVHANCFMAFGHGHLGLTLGPITGRLIAEAILGAGCSVNLQPFSPNRFDGN